MKLKKYKLAVFLPHPIYYHTPLFKVLAERYGVDVMVYFGSGTDKEEWYRGVYDKELGKKLARGMKRNEPTLEGYKHKSLRNYGWGSTNLLFSWVNPAIVVELIKNRNKYDAILIHGYNHFTNWLVFLVTLFTKTSLILRGETDLIGERSRLRKFVKRLILPPLFKTADAILYTCRMNKEYYLHYGVSQNKLFFLPCCVDNEMWQKKAKELKSQVKNIKESIGISNDYPVILFVGKLAKRKRPFDLLKAHQRLQRDGTEINMVFVGDGPQRKRLELFVEENKLRNVFFVGFKSQSEMASFYSIGDIFVMPSEIDVAPKAINEAMNFGLPIITTTGVGTGPDLIEESGSGLIYPVGDVGALADCLRKLIADSEFRKAVGKRAFDAMGKWNFDEEAKGLLEALDYVDSKKRK